MFEFSFFRPNGVASVLTPGDCRCINTDMAKDELIIVRVDGAFKRRIEAAARRQGKSITSFLIAAAGTAARKVEAMSETTVAKPKGNGACPSYFVALCHEATSGGESGYRRAGHELTRHITDELDWELADKERDARIRELRDLICERDDEGVLAWFDCEVPRCMQLVPRRRRQQFLRGVYEMVDEAGSVL